MTQERITVLKFGGSVLRDEGDLPRVVHEIYRHWRRGSQIVAVVSAFGGATDELLRRSRHYGDDASPHALASLLSTGESTSAALLTLALDRAGIPAKLLTAEQAGIRTAGPVLDSDLVAADIPRLRRELEQTVVIVSGFAGINDDGDVTLLGRGGTDYTALFLANRLSAGCVLLKDVDGLYLSDPDRGDRPVRRYARASYRTVARLGGELVQDKAIGFAEANRQQFEIGAIGSDDRTTVGQHPDELAAPRAARSRVRVALLGCGTVGGGVYQRLTDLRDIFEIVGVVNLDPDKASRSGIELEHIECDARRLIERECDVVIELIGGIEPALSYIEHALRNRRHVVTANKALLAEHGARLLKLAAGNGVTLRYSASVGGALPALEAVAQAGEISQSITGIINGTCNFIFDKLAAGSDYESAVRLAQEAGFAEADPTLDLNGTDAAQKLVLLIRESFGVEIPLAAVEREGIDQIEPSKVRDARERGNAYRLVAECRKTAGGISASVKPREFAGSHRFAQIRGADNCLVIEKADGQLTILRGRGAGRHATTEAVIADLFDIREAVGSSVICKEAAA